MKQTLSLMILGLGLIVACQAPHTSPQESSTAASAAAPRDQGSAAERATGQDADAHGCIASAGYVWSEARQACIRVWEAGAQFTPADQKSGDTRVAFVVLSKDRVKAEVFFTGRPPVLLNATVYRRDDPLRILYTTADHTVELYFENEKFFIAENGRATFSEPYSVTTGLGQVLRQH